MRTVLFLYFSVIVLLVLSVAFVVYKGQYGTLLQTYTKERILWEDDQHVIDIKSFDKKEASGKMSDCRFAFGFLKELIKQIKPINRAAVDVAFHRPFTGAIRQGEVCADSMDGAEGDLVGIGQCHGQGRNQEWTFTEVKQIQSEGTGTLCLAWINAMHGGEKNIILQKCNTVNIKQKWHFDKARKHLMPTVNPRMCVTSKDTILVLSKCNASLKTQMWTVVMTEVLNIELQVGH